MYGGETHEEQLCVCVCVCVFRTRTAAFLVRAIFAVLLLVTLRVQFTDAAPVPTAEGEV